MDYKQFALPHDISSQPSFCESVLHINCRSACNKQDSIQILLNAFAFQYDIIMLSETWYHNGCDVLKLQGYDSFFLNRCNARGGGVAVYITLRKNCELLSDYSKVTSDYEVLAVRNKNQVICAVYRPPHGNFATFLDFFETLLDYVCVNNCVLICGGDFNVKHFGKLT